MQIPTIGYLRLKQIIGDPLADPPVPGIFPISKSTWWQGVKDGRFPKGVKLSERVTAWKAEDIRALINRLDADHAGEAQPK
jgi:prophage regulatory protein